MYKIIWPVSLKKIYPLENKFQKCWISNTIDCAIKWHNENILYCYPNRKTQHWCWMENSDPNIQERADQGGIQSTGEKTGL